jgi:uncharacterized damage-inducible protein DinB
MDSITLIRETHRWMHWLTGRTLEAASALPDADFRREFPIGSGSVHGTLTHLLGAERIWMSAIQGNATAVMATTEEFPSIDSMRIGWPVIRGAWATYLSQLTDDECSRVVMRVRDGKEVRQLVRDILVQLPTHALYHNAQMSFMFRQMGHSLPDSSWILWRREQLAQTKQ